MGNEGLGRERVWLGYGELIYHWLSGKKGTTRLRAKKEKKSEP